MNQDFPAFAVSNAISRDHYQLVKDIEATTNSSSIISGQVQLIKQRLSRAHNTAVTIECLVELLHCNNATDSILNLEFALKHAIDLIEVGKTTAEKRIGYLFCGEIMSEEHELQLMLINSLRKDLESHNIPHICLALDYLISSVSPTSAGYIIPAITPRITDIISHTSPHVRRKALHATRILGLSDTPVVRHKVKKRLNDEKEEVIAAALHLAIQHGNDTHAYISSGLRKAWEGTTNVKKRKRILPKYLRAIEVVGKTTEAETLIQEITEFACYSTKSRALLLACIRSSPQGARVGSLLPAIRPLLVSQDIDDQYTFLLIIRCIPAIHPLLDTRETERFQDLLNSQDSLIRRQTMDFLPKSVLESHLAHLQAIKCEGKTRRENIAIQLEIIHRLVVVLGDGDKYARQVEGIFPSDMFDPAVHANVVAAVLTKIKESDEDFQSASISSILSLVHPTTSQTISPTLLVIISALAVSHAPLLPSSASSVLHGLVSVLMSGREVYSGDVQDAVVVAIIRLVAEVDMPVENDAEELWVGNLRKVEQRTGSGRVRQRLHSLFAFLTPSGRERLRSIVSTASSADITGFLQVLTPVTSPANSPKARLSSPLPPRSSSSLSFASSTASTSSKRLRYKAYDAPPPVLAGSILRPKVSSNSSSPSRRPRGRTGRWDGNASEETITPGAGDLTLAAADAATNLAAPPSSKTKAPVEEIPLVPTSPTRRSTDLMLFDSPFILDLSAETVPIVSEQEQEPDFDAVWNTHSKDVALSSRGWCEASLDSLIARIRGLGAGYRVSVSPIDVNNPFLDETRVTIKTPSGIAALRLRPADSGEEGCLWRLKTGPNDGILFADIKSVLNR